eukprot:UN2755
MMFVSSSRLRYPSLDKSACSKSSVSLFTKCLHVLHLVFQEERRYYPDHGKDGRCDVHDKGDRPVAAHILDQRPYIVGPTPAEGDLEVRQERPGGAAVVAVDPVTRGRVVGRFGDKGLQPLAEEE